MTGIEKTGSCTIFFKAIQHGIKPYYILPLVKIASRVLSWKAFSKTLPLPDWHIITEEGNEFLLLSMILYLTGIGIVWLAALGIGASLVFCESTFHKLATKFLARTVTGSVKLSDWLIGGFHKLPEIVATILVILSISTCGGLSLCLGCIFYFLKLTQMSQDYVEQIVLRVLKYFAKKFRKTAPAQGETNLEVPKSSQDVESVDDDINEECLKIEDVDAVEEDEKADEDDLEEVESVHDENEAENKDVDVSESKETEQKEVVAGFNDKLDCDGIFFHFSIFMLWCVVAALNVPSVLTWAHNFKYSTTLKPDPSFIPGFIMSLCALPLWHMNLPKRNLWGYFQLSQVINVMSGITLIYGSLSLYRLNYIITSTIVLVTLQQMFSWEREVNEDEDRHDGVTDTQTPEHLYSEVKAKWE